MVTTLSMKEFKIDLSNDLKSTNTYEVAVEDDWDDWDDEEDDGHVIYVRD